MSSLSTSAKPKQPDIDRLFDGAIEPSDQAYVDVFLSCSNEEVDLNHVSIHSSQDQSYSETQGDCTSTFYHGLHYKGEVVWRIEVCSNSSHDPSGDYTSTCSMLEKGRLEIKIERKGREWMGDKRNFSRKRRYDISSLVRGSAVAYQMFAAEQEIGQQYDILNQDDLATESFSEYMAEVSDDSEDINNESDDERSHMSEESARSNASSAASSVSSYMLSVFGGDAADRKVPSTDKVVRDMNSCSCDSITKFEPDGANKQSCFGFLDMMKFSK
jgi:hypothetical protein